MKLDKSYYEFLILTKHQDCLDDVEKVRKKHKFEPFETRDEALAWTVEQDKKGSKKKRKSLFAEIRDDSKKIVQDYQKKNSKDKRFVDMFNWFVLTNQEVFVHDKAIRVECYAQRKPREDEYVFVYLKKGLTRERYLQEWDWSIKDVLDELPDTEYMKSVKNSRTDFDKKLALYKCYLRAMNQQKSSSSIFVKLYETDEVKKIVDSLQNSDNVAGDTFRKTITSFKKEFGHLNIISQKELERPIL